MYICVRVCVCVCMYIYMCVCVCVCIYIYTHTLTHIGHQKNGIRSRISKDEVKDALRKRISEKVVGPNLIHVEILKCWVEDRM